MRFFRLSTLGFALLSLSSQAAVTATTALPQSVAADYQQHLGALFTHFHQNPELSHMEVNTAARLAKELKAAAVDKQQSLVHKNQTIEATLKGLGVVWLRNVDNYDVAAMRRTLESAFTSDFTGLKVIIAEGECQLERQRRIKPWIASLLKRGERVARVKYGVDEDVCTGDHACIRLSGCPTLTLKDNPDPLKLDPVATVIDGCVGCGLCGENAHAATLCPSFYRAEVVRNPKWHERAIAGLRRSVIRLLQPA